MNINLDNYETFFLLYVDGELTSAEREAVDVFIEQHPYLGEELQMMRSLVLPADEPVLIDKNILYRQVAMEHNMEEAMLLHLDAELPAAQARQLEESIAADATLQQNWDLLLRTRLPQEAIVFADKKSLYKQEPATVVSFRFVRWAVAAALLAAGLFTAITLLRQQAQPAPEFANTEIAVPATDSNKGQQVKADPLLATENTVEVATAEKEIELARQETVDQQRAEGLENIVPAKYSPDRKSADLANVKKPALSEQKKDAPVLTQDQPMNVLVANNNAVPMPANKRELKMQNSLATMDERPDIIDRNIADTKQDYAKFASLQEEDEESNDRILGMDADAVGRTKAGIFFKKLKRTVTRTANIQTGNSLKIAGFEFAVQ